MKDRQLKKQLRNQAKILLPDDSLKQSVKSRLFGNAEKEVAQTRKQPKRAHMPRYNRVIAAVAACAVMCVSLGLGLGFGLGNRNAMPAVSDTYVTISINPSFFIAADKNDIVTEVVALNEDAAITLYGEALIGLRLDEACDKILSLCVELGYLTENGEANLVAVNDNIDKQKEIANKIKAQIDTSGILSANNLTLTLNSGKSSLVASIADLGLNASVNLSLAEIGTIVEDFSTTEFSDFMAQLDEHYNDAIAAAKKTVLNDIKPAIGAFLEAEEQFKNNRLDIFGFLIACDELYDAISKLIDASKNDILANLQDIITNFNPVGSVSYSFLLELNGFLDEMLSADDNFIGDIVLEDIKFKWKEVYKP